jgi:hypothetical protein
MSCFVGKMPSGLPFHSCFDREDLLDINLFINFEQSRWFFCLKWNNSTCPSSPKSFTKHHFQGIASYGFDAGDGVTGFLSSLAGNNLTAIVLLLLDHFRTWHHVWLLKQRFCHWCNLADETKVTVNDPTSKSGLHKANFQTTKKATTSAFSFFQTPSIPACQKTIGSRNGEYQRFCSFRARN